MIALVAFSVARCSDTPTSSSDAIDKAFGSLPGYPLVSVQPSLDTIAVGARRTLTAKLTDARGNTWTCGSCAWSSSDPSVATISGVGATTLKGVAPGVVTLTARTGSGTSGKLTVTVGGAGGGGTGPGTAALHVTPSIDTLVIGASQMLTALLTDAANDTTVCHGCTWNSSDTTVARVVSGVGQAQLTALKAGVVTITASAASSGASGAATSAGDPLVASVFVTVLGSPPPAAAYPLVEMLPALDTITVGATRVLSARLTNSSGYIWVCGSCTWSSSDPAVATVTGVGKATLKAIKNGVVTITSTTGSHTTGTRTITVGAGSGGGGGSYPLVKIVPALDTITKGAGRALSATLTNAAGTSTTCTGCTWQSSAPSIASVSGVGQAQLSALRAGVVTITAKSGNNTTGTRTITVYDPPTAPGARTGYYVTPGGSSSGDGSALRPWNLATALQHPSKLNAGDTIWLRAGTYAGNFTSRLNGNATRPIVVRAYPQERVTIDGSLTVTGTWTWYWGFELFNAKGSRVSSSTSAATGGIHANGPNNKYINLIVHDTHGSGIGTNGTGSGGTEIYGSLIYNNGWEGPDRGHGHGIYAQNLTGTKRIVDNIIFNQFGWGLHIYGSKAASLRNFHIEGNIAFTNGSLSRKDGANPDVLVGGGSAAGRIVFTDNFTYQPRGDRTVKLGYDELNDDLTATNNYLVGETQIINWRTIRFTDNVLTTGIFAPSARVALWHLSNGAPKAGHTWRNNRYTVVATTNKPLTVADNGKWTSHNFSGWRNATGFDSNSMFTAAAPTGVEVFVRANRFEAGRAHVVVYNWAGAGNATADLSGILKPGDRYEVRHAQDYFGAPATTGSFGGGSISIPLAARRPADPYGVGWAQPPTIAPTFNVFVVIKL